MLKKKVNSGLIALGVTSLMLGGCASQGTEVFSVNNKSVTTTDIEEYLYYANGMSKAHELILNKMFDNLFKKEWDEELNKEIDDFWYELTSGENFETSTKEYILESYDSLDAYKEDYVKPTMKQAVVIKHYIKDNIDSFYDSYTPVKVKLYALDSEDEAKEWVSSLESKSITEIATEKGVEVTEATLSKNTTEYPTDLLDAVLANETGKSLTPVADTGNNKWYVFETVLKDKNNDEMVEILSELVNSDTDKQKEILQTLLTENHLEIHDADFLNLATFSRSILIPEAEE